MDRWEYLNIEYWSQRQDDDSLRWFATFATNDEELEDISLQELLNNLGEQGWELIAQTVNDLSLRRTKPKQTIMTPQVVGAQVRSFDLILKRKRA